VQGGEGARGREEGTPRSIFIRASEGGNAAQRKALQRQKRRPMAIGFFSEFEEWEEGSGIQSAERENGGESRTGPTGEIEGEERFHS